jgi:hypothetical protein
MNISKRLKASSQGKDYIVDLQNVTFPTIIGLEAQTDYTITQNGTEPFDVIIKCKLGLRYTKVYQNKF